MQHCKGKTALNITVFLIQHQFLGKMRREDKHCLLYLNDQ